MNTKKLCAQNVKMIAHQGASGLERGNTCSAFVAAGNRSYFGIETDVHVSADGKFVICHDETLTNVTGGKCDTNIEKSNYVDYKDITLSDIDGSFYRGDLRVPLLEEYIKICKKYEKICVLEVKNLFSEDDIKRLVEEIDIYGYLENVIFISFFTENCLNLRKLLPTARIQCLYWDRKVDQELVDFLKSNRFDIDIMYTLLNEEDVTLLHKNGISVNCWTCDDMESAKKLVEYGVDFITSNIIE